MALCLLKEHRWPRWQLNLLTFSYRHWPSLPYIHLRSPSYSLIRLYSTCNYFPSFSFFYFIYPYQFSFTLCAFHSTKIPVWNFGNSTCQMERFITVTQTRPKPPRVSLLFLQAGYKGAVLRTTICQMERDISVQPTEMTGPFKVDRPPSKMSRIFW